VTIRVVRADRGQRDPCPDDVQERRVLLVGI